MIALLQRWRRLRGDRSGVSAIEFAIIAPVLLTFFFGSIEISDALIADRKATTLASTAADLVAQDTEISNDEMGDIFAALTAIMFPYDPAGTQIVISSVEANAAGQLRIGWSDGFNSPPRAVGSSVSLPTGIVAPLGSVIMAEVTYSYTEANAKFLTSGLVMDDRFILKPRRSLRVQRIP